MSRNNYDLLERTMFGYRVVAENILPTPFLMDATYPPKPVDAYESDPATADSPAIWRARDDAYDAKHAPGVKYTTVWAVTRHVPAPEPEYMEESDDFDS